ncbi:pilus assembly protein TadA [Bacteriovorax stolpii]|uniref:Pilus assembly protein TadA n=1 Tax=Bacteriovorax stolpii TaxID=960 RepID=A0A2K9NPK8_BACTC|nr:ATPase, T2SS/T4P/T4SS family [Bacteriovorax stolpii]AUN96704.1 pilus assembly protein TadA [Bacteriovorax stolpii]QDK43365.1 pilus assembly protein TadA [Bacteriovorax stolpii]TDP53775.1 septum site-determining protein MinD [Bacteriovorax stolpii]
MAGHIISIIGGKGGLGKSQVAANLAFAYAIEGKVKTLLLDFDQKASGDQDFITGMKGKKNLKELADFKGAIDPNSIQQFVNMNQNVFYIGMPNDPTAAEGIEVEALGRTLKAVTNIYPITIIDAGNELTPLAIKALEFSTLIFVVVTPDILALNQTKRLYSDLVTMMFPKDMIQFVINQAQQGHPVTNDVIAKTLGKPAFSVIPRDDQNCTLALNQKKPVMLVARNSNFAKGVIDTVRRLNEKSILRALEKLNKPSDVGQKKATPAGGEAGAEGGGPTKGGKSPWTDLKSRIHRALVEEMDLKKADDNDPKAQIILKEQTKKVVVELLGKEDTKGILNTREDMNQIVKEILDEALGLGPLEDLLRDKSISEVMVVGPYKIYYEQGGKIKLSEITFTNDRQVLNVIERIVAPIGRRIDEKTPYVDARLKDGSRVHAIIPPSAIDGCSITIRKFPEKRLTYKDLVKFGSMTENMADFLRIAVEAHRNIIVSGGTGSGKTTLINVLGGFIQSNERIITCEDSAELNFPQEHIVRLETRPPSLEGDGAIDIRCLVKQTLRMRPDRIVVGECRGGETLDMLQAMGTGHDGSMTTVHSNNPRECIGRLETLVQYAGTSISPRAIKEMIANAVHMIIQQSRLDDGSRRVMYITEIAGMQGDTVILQDIFLFIQKEIDKNGKILGEFQATGFIPKFIEVLERKGYNVPRGIFSNRPPQAAPATAAPAAAPAAGGVPKPPTSGGAAPAGAVKPPVKK